MPPLSKGANVAVPSAPVRVVLRHDPRPGVPDIDGSALLLTAEGKVRDDGDLVFYNAPTHTGGAVRHLGKDAAAGTETLTVDLATVEADIAKVVLAASADGGTFGKVPGLSLVLLDTAGGVLAEFDIADATEETAFVFGELYRRGGGWKFRAVGQGYATGLAGLATDFGISVDDPPPAAPAPPATPAIPAAPAPAPRPAAVSLRKQQQIDLVKRAQTQAPHMVSLVKAAAVSLEKKGLGEHVARVALCLDISASMRPLFRAGKVQQLVERLLALAMRLDDDGAVEVFLFGEFGHAAGTVGVENITGFTDRLLGRFPLEGRTDYSVAMRLIRAHYFGSADARRTILRDRQSPVYCLFVTDGQTLNEHAATEQVRSSSYEPLFWQFIAVGDHAPNSLSKPAKGGRRGSVRGNQFRYLEELDSMTGRRVDNAAFFAVSDPITIPDPELFDLMMAEYPGWLAAG